MTQKTRLCRYLVPALLGRFWWRWMLLFSHFSFCISSVWFLQCIMTSMTMPPDTRPRASLYFARSLHALQAPPRYHRFCSLTLADGSGCLACLLLIAVSGCIDVFDRLEVRGVVRWFFATGLCTNIHFSGTPMSIITPHHHIHHINSTHNPSLPPPIPSPPVPHPSPSRDF